VGTTAPPAQSPEEISDVRAARGEVFGAGLATVPPTGAEAGIVTRTEADCLRSVREADARSWKTGRSFFLGKSGNSLPLCVLEARAASVAGAEELPVPEFSEPAPEFSEPGPDVSSPVPEVPEASVGRPAGTGPADGRGGTDRTCGKTFAPLLGETAGLPVTDDKPAPWGDFRRRAGGGLSEGPVELTDDDEVEADGFGILDRDADDIPDLSNDDDADDNPDLSDDDDDADDNPDLSDLSDDDDDDEDEDEDDEDVRDEDHEEDEDDVLDNDEDVGDEEDENDVPDNEEEDAVEEESVRFVAARDAVREKAKARHAGAVKALDDARASAAGFGAVAVGKAVGNVRPAGRGDPAADKFVDAAEEGGRGPRGADLVHNTIPELRMQGTVFLRGLLTAVLALLLSLGLNVYFVSTGEEPRYFGFTRDLRLIEMPPLSEPVADSHSISNWLADVVTKSLSLNFLRWRQTLTEVRPEFDPAGFESFVKALEAGGQIKKIEEERLSLSCVVGGAPVVTGSRTRNGVMTWSVEMPLVLSYESSTGVVASQKLLAEIAVQRTRTTVNPRGVVIRQLVLNKAG
ncbi:MAG: DotI/IcmL/TraM family protein, partial [Deltaproteobacteria bacterium]|nr:DotI/IcmL/TraM family protein [Deltaproteobacteria bacterium]